MTTIESASFCDICQSRDLNKSAEEYCPQCEESLCGDCRHHHKISRSAKSHQTIAIEKYNKLPSFIKQIKHNCEEHDCFFEFYCKSHESLCCKICLISGHKECKEIIFIEDFLTPSKGHQSVALDHIEKVLKDLESNISSAIKDRYRNLKELREQKQVVAEQIKEKRQEINTLLDHLEGALQEEASAMEKEYCKKIEEVIAKLNEEKRKVDESQKDVESVKMYASNLQIFIGTKAFQENVSINEINVHILNDNGNLNNYTMQYKLNDKLEGLIKEIKTFGDMKVDNSEKHVSFSWKGDTSAQIFKPISRVKSIEHLNLRLVHKIHINRNSITGCAISEAGDMLFLQLHSNNLLKFGPYGELTSESGINPGQHKIGYDLAAVDSNTVAISSGGNDPQQIYLIDMNSVETRQVFQLNDWCCGLSFHNESFICCTYYNGIKIYEKSHHQLTNTQTLRNAPSTVSHTYITSNENFIFHSNWRDHSVVCYDFCGQVQWKYSDLLLRKPHGITLDTNSNIYVAGSDSNNIVVISPDGKKAKELVGASDGISSPRALFFHKTKHMLLVANYNKVAFMYDVI